MCLLLFIRLIIIFDFFFHPSCFALGLYIITICAVVPNTHYSSYTFGDSDVGFSTYTCTVYNSKCNGDNFKIKKGGDSK